MRRRKNARGDGDRSTAGDIAIVGLALRLPGSETLDDLWRDLAAGRSRIGPVPAERWDRDALYGDPRRDDGKTNSIWGGFVDEADGFDAAFFGISPREARSMDPQQRFALELSWRAVEDAGIAPGRLAGRPIGVFMGCCHWDYAELFEQSGQSPDAYLPTGVAYSIIANRVSYFFDFTGPSVTSDVACASSLVAVEQAVQALRSGACHMALAGGVNLIWSATHFIAFAKNGMLSRTGRSRAFDADADGYVRGEGGVVLLLQPLVKARAEGRAIHAVIKAIGSNHGGRTSALTVTSAAAQARLIREVHRAAGIHPASVGYIEAHGTGTPVGDPIEVLGLKTAFADLYADFGDQPRAGTCGLGSVKTNIGHLEGAAGVAGIAKVVAAMRYRQLPPNVGFERPNPMLNLDGSPFYVVDALRPWRANGKLPSRAAVSSIGFGGSNAHVVLESPSATRKVRRKKPRVVLVPLSARDGERLRAACRGLAGWLDARAEPVDLAALAFTLQTGRDAMAARAAFLAEDVPTLGRALTAAGEGRTLPPNAWMSEAAEGGSGVDPVPREALLDGRFDEIAARWVAGATVEWEALYEKEKPPRPLRLPTYPFARERFWLVGSDRVEAARKAAAHPLLSFRAEMPGRGFAALDPAAFYLADHTIGGRSILPGVVGLELARAAAAREASGPIALTDVVWLAPIEAATARTVEVVRDSNGFRIVEGENRFCEGRIGPARESASLDVAATRARCPHLLAAAALYDRLSAAGINHGPAFRAVQTLQVGDGVAVADLRLDASRLADAARWFVHPVMLDAAIQAAAAVLRPGAAAGLPFAVDRVDIWGATAPRMAAVVRAVGDLSGPTRRFDIDLCGVDGDVRVRLTGLVTRPAAGPGAVMDPPAVGLVQAVPEWVSRAPPPAADGAAYPAALFLPARCEHLAEPLSARLGIAVHRLAPLTGAIDVAGIEAVVLGLIAFLREGMAENRPGRCVVVLPDGEEGEILLPALAALMGTVGRESSHLDGCAVMVEGLDHATPESLAARLLPELAAPDGAVAVRLAGDGGRAVRRYRTVPGAAAEAGPVWRADGVYWITGGLGGLGRLFAAHLAGAGVGSLVLSGRSSAAVEPVLADLAAKGVRAEYMPLDVADETAVRRTVAAIRARHGGLTGLLHCAGVLRDGLLRAKEPAAAAAVLAPKLRGAVNLDAATADLDLEMFLLCSSIAAAYGNVGQSDYAAANGFLDGFAAWRRGEVAAGRRRGRTLAVNWPLWAEGGMTVSPDTLAAIGRRMGALPMPSDVGLGALDGLAGIDRGPQVVVAYGRTAELAHFLAEGDAKAVPAVAAASATAMDAGLREATLDYLRRVMGGVLDMTPGKIRPDMAFANYGFDSIVAVEMVGKLEQDLGPLPKTLFFEHVDLNGIADHLLADRAEAVRTAVMPDAQPAVASTPPAAVEAAAPGLLSRREGRRAIAVIGMGGRYPGAATLDEFWENLAHGRHAFRPIPAERWPHEAIYFPERDVAGKSTIRTGGFLDDIDCFDPRYFSISRREAELMSPEVRLFLEVAVETFEDAGYSREWLQRQYGGDVGVLVGTMSNHYNLYGAQNMMARGTRATGSYTGTLPNMVSYYYGLTGPSIFVDTMCSASSTCVDLAVRLLREGQTRMVLTGGVNLLLHPYNLISSSQEHFTSNTAEIIRSYGLGADGTILGEGVGAVLLKPLDDAERDGDDIRAVIAGTALTNAGVRNGFTVPNPAMQAKAIRRALDDAGFDAGTISYVEGHGSGTSLGDPIEIAGLTQAFQEDTVERGFCALGSVKSNIAHLLAAAGVAGLTKVLLQLRHGKIAPSLHSEALNPAIDFESSPFRVQRTLTDWKRPVVVEDGIPHTLPRRAGITSIGAGGMNSHIVVEEYVAAAPDRPPPAAGVSRLVVFSAMNREALEGVLARMRRWLDAHPDADMVRLSYTLQVGRTALPCRLALVVSGRDELLAAMDAFGAGAPRENLWFVPDILEVEAPASEPLERACHDGDVGAVARGWTAGAAVDWTLLWGDARPRRMALPTYPFEKVRCWVEMDTDAPTVLDPESNRRKLHPLVGRNVSDLRGVAFETYLRVDDLLDWRYRRAGRPHLAETILPEAALAALRLAGLADPALADLRIEACDWAAVRRLEFRLPEGGAAIEITGEVDGGQPVTLLCARCVSAARSAALATDAEPATAKVMAGEEVYDILAEAGLTFAPYQAVLSGVRWGTDGGGEADVASPAYRQHPRMNNLGLAPEAAGAIVQVALLAARRLGIEGWPDLELAAAESFAVPGIGAEGPWRLRFAAHREGAGIAGSWTVLDGAGLPAAHLEGARFLPPHAIAAAGAGQALEADTGGVEMLDFLRWELSDILKLPAEEIHPRIGLYALGLDSISLTALIGRVNAAFGTAFTPALTYEVDTVDELARKLVEGGARPAARPVRPAAAPVPKAPVRTSAAGVGEPIAVVGMAGRFPGAEDVDAYWRLLRDGRQALSDLPLDRYGPAYARRMAAAPFPKRGGFLSDVARFDADFFTLSPAEAEHMDPQHRLFLETAWATVESAGYRPRALPGDTGVFVGVSGHDYALLMAAQGVEPDAHVSTGTSHAMLANRVSFLLDIHGPSEAIDTACSSSLVAVHRAMEAIRAGRCSMAMAGGVNLALCLESFLGPQRAGMLSPVGRCKTFADDADGYVRGEGVGAVLLKPLRTAERDGDPIVGVLIGSAENHGGRAGSLTAPNARAQTDVILRAMAGIDPATIGCVEAHGTGTALGDPIEVNALKAAFAKAAEPFGNRRAPGSCGLGSVKTNIGHLEAAAGIAGLIKLLLALRAAEMPPTLDCPRLNPYLELAGSPFAVVDGRRPWPTGNGQPRRAAVSSFGFGGVNAHVVVEEYRRPVERSPQRARPGGVPVVLSARTPGQLAALARRLADAVAGPSDTPLESIAWTLQAGRESMEERLAFPANSKAEMAAALRAFAAGDEDRVLRGRVRLASGFPATRAEGEGRPAVDELYAAGDPSPLLTHWIEGGAVDWTRLWDGTPPSRAVLPTYPFAGRAHWIEPQAIASATVVPLRASGEAAALRLLDRIIEGDVDIDEAARMVARGQP